MLCWKNAAKQHPFSHVLIFHGKTTPLCRTKQIHDKGVISNLVDEGMGSPKPP